VEAPKIRSLAFFGTLSHKVATTLEAKRMFDATTARRLMVDGQIRTADVTDAALLDAMLTVPREQFLPPTLAPLAYLDADIPIGKGCALLRPMVLAKLIQAAHIRAGERVLDIGCATGYSAAILARLGASVVALEEDPDLANAARTALAAIGAADSEVVIGPLASGWPAGAPYDLILLNGAAEVVPDALGGQLKPEGRLIGIGGNPPASKGMVYRVTEGHLLGRPIFDAAASLLPGFRTPPSFVF
jgi:protein-L-isoaspartate(D-aspartate) O-methyltransferase